MLSGRPAPPWGAGVGAGAGAGAVGRRGRAALLPALALLAPLLLLLLRSPLLGPAAAAANAFVAGAGQARRTATSCRALAESDLSPAQRAELESFLAKHVLDEEALRKEHTFPLSEEELIRRSKLYLALNHWAVTAPELLAEDFEFCGSVIGPLNKEKFIEQLGSFDFAGAFPDTVDEFHHFRRDPWEPDRVWFTCRGTGTNTGAVPPLVPEATGKRFENPPQACSLKFNEAGEVTQYTLGYVMDRRLGNTGGLGGLLGILWCIGKPFPYPESQPYQRSWQRNLFEGAVNFLLTLQGKSTV